MIKRKLYLVGMFMLASIYTHAQNSTPLSLSEAWQLAFEHYPEFTEQKALIKASAYNKRAVKNSYLPNLQLQLQNTYGSYEGSAGGFFPLPGIFNVTPKPALENQPDATSSFYSSAVVDWKIFEFGRRNKALEVATFQQNAAQNGLLASQVAVQAKVSRLFVAVEYNQANLTWAKANAERLEKILSLSKSLAAAGLKAGADSLLAASVHQQAVAGTKSWQGKLNSSKVQLSELISLSPGSIQVSSSSFMPSDVGPMKLTQDTVAAGHPYLEVLDQQVNVANARKELAERQKYPSLSFLGGLSTRGSGVDAGGNVSREWGAGFNNRADNYLVGLGLTWNLTAGYTSTLQSKEAGAQLAATKARYDKQALQLTASLQAVEANMQEQLQQLEATQQALENASKAYELYLSRYENGLISLTELLQLQSVLQQLEKDNIEAHQQYWDQAIMQAEVSGDFSYLSTKF
ncbi:TolC family protein [Pontibacter anaerobius]|uniref:TolC family protein n=1 Tax=Pontibacter anaerobius TaxID=2993940 RepID=A0ABT3RBM7_9BACT|nr:TolC family protein [Pontibacter anaerobius]MCX2739009.1 TolC family protein [Pontibacter anaerobius]